MRCTMRSLVVTGIALAVSVAAASAADAQAETTPGERSGFWIGFGFGHGSLGCENCGGQRAGALSGNFRLGGTLSQKVLVGFETNGWYREESGGTLAMGNASAVVVFYPSETGGLHLKGGLGVAVAEARFGSLRESETGGGALLGLGYDARIARNFSLTPFLNMLGGSFDGGSANFWQVGLGVSWH